MCTHVTIQYYSGIHRGYVCLCVCVLMYKTFMYNITARESISVFSMLSWETTRNLTSIVRQDCLRFSMGKIILFKLKFPWTEHYTVNERTDFLSLFNLIHYNLMSSIHKWWANKPCNCLQCTLQWINLSSLYTNAISYGLNFKSKIGMNGKNAITVCSFQ